jgi:hypothetical protein
MWPNKRLKKVPLPWGIKRDMAHPWSEELARIIKDRFVVIYGIRSSISTAERKMWASFLLERGIKWEIKVSREPCWERWEVFRGEECLLARPEGLERHIKVSHYFVPHDLALKMLVLQDLP